MAEVQRSEDLTLAPNEFALVLDRTNGAVHTYCGPSNTSLSAQEYPVIFDYGSKRFTTADLSRAKQLKQLAPEGWYIILKNPAVNGVQPEDGKKARMPDLNVGHKVNIPGPTSFALWPGQMAQVIQGHHLRQDEYLIARVYDGDAAKTSMGIVAKQDDGAGLADSLIPKQLIPGYLFIIKGTEASFYIPPTGIEVVRDVVDPAKGTAKAVIRYVRSAVSLERLEYCLLRDQDGNKRYVRGPAVVFPKPTEAFVTRSDGETRKFKAIELGIKNGIHVKVIAEYKDEATGDLVKAGTELFIKGEDTPIYFPREEHSIIKYGDSDVNFGVAIPPGEARYVLQRNTGEISLQKGPMVFLPDPRTECIVRRVLDHRLCALMYPGNAEALQVNQTLAAAARVEQPGLDYLDVDMNRSVGTEPLLYAQSFTTSDTALPSAAVAGFHGDVTNRRGQYRPPRTITIDSKYQGAVTMDIHEGYAVMLVTKRGGRRVVIGPRTALLEYDEVPHVLTLSTGKPKTMDKPLKTVYLMVANNYVTDIIDAETRDYCKVKMKLSYRLNFEGSTPEDAETWFSVENYVKLLCDHMRSMIRNRVRHLNIKDFYHNATDILRDLILGAPIEAARVGEETPPTTRGSRPGRAFEENGLRIFDVEVLQVDLDKEMQALLEGQEKAAIQQALALEDLKRKADYAEQTRELHVKILDSEDLLKRRREASNRKQLEDTAETQKTSQAIIKATQEAANEVAEISRLNQQADHELKIRIQTALDALKLNFIKEETEATAARMRAITPDLIAALTTFGEQAAVERLATAMSVQGFLRTVGGESIVDVLSKILQGSGLAERLPNALNGKLGVAAKQLST